MARRSLPLHTYLLLLVLGAMLPGVALTALLVAQTLSNNREVIVRRLLDAARVDAEALDHELEGSIRALDTLATSPSLDRGDLRTFHAEARRAQLAQRGWYTVVLLSLDGHQLVSTRLPWGTPLLTVSDAQSLRELVARRRPIVGRLRGPQPGEGKQHLFAVLVPVVRDGELRYALSAILDASSLSRLVASRLPATEEWTRTILDSKGVVAARTRDAGRFVGRPATPSFRARIAQGIDQLFRETALDGTPVYAATARSAYGWTSAIIVPRSVLDAPRRGSTGALLLGGALLTLGTLTALLLVSRRIAGDLGAVARSAAAVAEGRPIGSAGAHVAEIRRLQESLQAAAVLLEQRQRERDEQVQRAEASRAEAEHANQTKDQFLAVLGHELRNPLAPALTTLEVMKLRDPHTFERERQVLERQVGHMVRLVNDLLDVSRLARGKVELRRGRFEAREAVDRAVDMARPLIDRHRHELRVDVPAAGLLLDGDEDRVVQVLTNLLTNAARYTPPGGHVALTAQADGEMAVLACEDDGPGIPPELAPTLFEPFAQGPRTVDRQQGGLGVGLALARSLTELHGGTLRHEPAASGHGSRFVVRLPLAGAEPLETEVQEAHLPPARGGAWRVLVVDDNPDAREMLRSALEEVGHVVTVAADGPEAIRRAAAAAPQIGILDIGLPGMDGYELARRLRRTHPDMRLIALTGYGQPSDARAAAHAGFDSHCTKPIQMTALLAEMEGRAAPIPPAPPASWGGPGEPGRRDS